MPPPDLQTILSLAWPFLGWLVAALEAFFLYKMYRTEQASSKYEERRFLLRRNSSTGKSFADGFLLTG
jgi:hypothetical protein